MKNTKKTEKKTQPINPTKDSEVSIKLLSKMWKELVYARADYKCEYCGRTDRIQAHHIYSRSLGPLKYDPDNGASLCPDCHKFNRLHSAHKGSLEFVLFIIKKRGENWLKMIMKKAREPMKKRIEIYKLLDEEIKKVLKEQDEKRK